jgi:membrane protein DedA with SNARE-associated domain/pimeloyl-ACP methyl ester carboxylesterase
VSFQSSFSIKTIIAALFAGLLGLSWLIQALFPPQPAENRWFTEGSTMNYLQLGEESERTPLFLMPDSYEGPRLLIPVAERLAEDRLVIIPLYSSLDEEESSYDTATRAEGVRRLIDELEFEEVHLAGYGYGGVTAAHLTDAAPGKTRSLALMASPGIQEVHFLGSYRVNRTLYSLLIPIHAVFRYAIPHFGYYHHQPFQRDYVRSMVEMDLRPMEEIFRSVEQPVLIIHPEDDPYIPLSSSKETYRIIPQSELTVEPGGYRDIYEDPGRWQALLSDWMNRVEAGEVADRTSASQERTERAQKPFDAEETDTISGWPLFILAVLIISVMLINEDFGCITSGLMVASGLLDFQYALMICFTGILISDVVVYSLGRWIGTPILNVRPFKWVIRKRDIERAEEMLEMKGAQIVFITRFLPGTRLPTYLAAGILKTNFLAFLGYFVMAISIWAPLLVGLSSLIGQPMLNYIELYQDYALWIIALFFLFVYGILKYVLPLTTVKGRRELYVKLVRLRERLTGE